MPPHTVARKRGLSNTDEAVTTGEKEINKGSKIQTGQKLTSEQIEQPPIKIISRVNYPNSQSTESIHRYGVIMSREYYLWCLVDRYLSMDNISYTEALEYARRDIYEIPKGGESISLLADHYILESRPSSGTFKQAHSRHWPYRSCKSSQK